MSLRGEQYTAVLNEFGGEGWELVNVVAEELPPPSHEKSSGAGFPMPRALGRIGAAADTLSKIGGGSEPADEQRTDATTRLLWVFRRPLGDA